MRCYQSHRQVICGGRLRGAFSATKGTKMNHTIHDVGVAKQIAAYSDSIEVKPSLRWLLSSGTPGLPTDGSALPTDITGQSELAWKHVVLMLEKAGMTVADIVKVTQYLTDANHIAE